MAGFFGLFNYEKEGPGISKNAPKKKTFIVFFETFLRNFWKFITINLVYTLISAPMLTNGLANVGLTNVTRNIARDKHSFGLSDFFDTIKRNWKQGLASGIINVLVYIILFFDFSFFNAQSNKTSATIGLGIMFALLFIFTVMNFYIPTLLITFKFTLKQIYKNSFKFVFINIKNNILCLISLAFFLAIYITLPLLIPSYFLLIVTVEFVFFICTFPAFSYLMIQFFIFPSIKKYIIDPYYLEHPDEDIDKRRDLGIEVDEPKPEKTEDESGEEEPENVFED